MQSPPQVWWLEGLHCASQLTYNVCILQSYMHTCYIHILHSHFLIHAYQSNFFFANSSLECKKNPGDHIVLKCHPWKVPVSLSGVGVGVWPCWSYCAYGQVLGGIESTPDSNDTKVTWLWRRAFVTLEKSWSCLYVGGVSAFRERALQCIFYSTHNLAKLENSHLLSPGSTHDVTTPLLSFQNASSSENHEAK